MLHITEYNRNDVWKLVKEIRRSFLSKNIEQDCNDQGTLINDENIKENIKKVQEKLNINKSMIIETISKTSCQQYYCGSSYIDIHFVFDTVRRETLETATEMFTYLNYCPPKLLLSMYEDLLKSASPRDIILAITTIRKTNHARESSELILKKIMETMKLTNYQSIQIITQGCINADQCKMKPSKFLGYCKK